MAIKKTAKKIAKKAAKSVAKKRSASFVVTTGEVMMTYAMLKGPKVVKVQQLNLDEQLKSLYSINGKKATKVLKKAGVLTEKGNLRAAFK